VLTPALSFYKRLNVYAAVIHDEVIATIHPLHLMNVGAREANIRYFHCIKKQLSRLRC